MLNGNILSPAEANMQRTPDLCRDIKANFLEVGRLLYENFQMGFWSTVWDCWSDYLDSLGIASRSWLSRLVNLAMCLDTHLLREADVIEMGVTNAIMLLPSCRDGTINGEKIAAAKSGSTRQLREALGHKGNENDRDYYVDCTHCGVRFYGAKWIKKTEEHS